MALHSKEIEMSLNLSSDAKPRLKWTQQLHQRFIDAVNQLGGAEKATPKSLMRIMGIHGLTLYHLKSHLQKYRLGKSHIPKSCQQSKQQDHEESPRSHISSKICSGAEEPINEGLQMAQALQLQMEVQQKLHEQIEVQRHLQLRIEAQGKYLQSVLKKAQETLSGYSACSIEVEHAKAQLSQLVAMVDSGCPSSSFSVLTESEGSMLKEARNKVLEYNRCSLESSLTSSERAESPSKHEVNTGYKGKRDSVALSLMEMHPIKRSKSTINDEKVGAECNDKQVRRSVLLENIDLNCKSMNDIDSEPKVIDLNCSMGVET